MLRSPELAKRAAHLGEFLRFSTSLPPRLSELAILVTARAWTAQYEWYAHAKLALKGGLDATIVDAIAERRDPPFRNEDERIVYEDRKSAVQGKSVVVRVDLGGRRLIKKKKNTTQRT